MLGEGDPKAAVPVVEHLTCHQCVEHGCARQRYTKVEAKHPPVLRIPVELQKNRHVRVTTLLKMIYSHCFMLCDLCLRWDSFASLPKKNLPSPR